MEARAYVDKGWCQGNWAQKEDGTDCSTRLHDGEMWCVSGAIALTAQTYHVGSNLHIQARRLFERAAGAGPIEFNDTLRRTKEDVLEAFDRAISLGLREAGDH